MKRKVTKKVREQAWLICAIAASTPDLAESYAEVCRLLDMEPVRFVAQTGGVTHEPAFDLALRAWGQCMGFEHPDAEAAALLAEGWTPEGWA